jgi:putative transcriptional regulator
MRWLPIAAMAVCCAAPVRWAAAQSVQPGDLAAGKLLVASKDLPDPNFARTVILLVQYDEDGVVGLILNRRSKVPISRLLGEVAGAKARPDPVYAGGPVGRTEVMALARHSSGDSKRVFGEIYLVSGKEDMQKTFATATDADAVHVYLGYSGWTKPQLENELDLGAWYIFPGSASAVFDDDPDSLWDRLIRKTELRIASYGRAGIFKLRAVGAAPPPFD